MRKDEIRTKNSLIEKLGGKCVECGSTENLEFDHIEPKNKKYDIGKILHQPSLLRTEILLCQLLCNTCHKKKSAIEQSARYASIPLVHGTERAYKRCGPPKCEDCRVFRRDYMRKYIGVKHPRK